MELVKVLGANEVAVMNWETGRAIPDAGLVEGCLMFDNLCNY